MKKWLALFLSIVLTLSLAVPALGADAELTAAEKAHISFGADGKFTILQIADIQDNATLSYLCKRAITYAVEESKPDLIVLTGDNYAGYRCKTVEKSKKAIKEFMDLFEGFGIPVAMVFGNHDDDSTPYTKLEQIAQYETYSCFVGRAGVIAERTDDGEYTINAGTYNIPIYASADSDDVIFNVWCFDSGNNHNPDPNYGGYGYVLSEQIDWYVETSDALREANGGKVVPSFAFQHIIPPQIYQALKETDKSTPGAVSHGGKYYTFPDGTDLTKNWMNESPSCASTDCPGAYTEVEAMLAQGDVKALFVGHDHINNYVVPYKGIDLVNTPGITYFSYNDLNRGFRVITVDKENTDTYETYTLFADALLRQGSFPDPFLAFLRRIYDRIYVFGRAAWEKIESVF